MDPYPNPGCTIWGQLRQDPHWQAQVTLDQLLASWGKDDRWYNFGCWGGSELAQGVTHALGADSFRKGAWPSCNLGLTLRVALDLVKYPCTDCHPTLKLTRSEGALCSTQCRCGNWWYPCAWTTAIMHRSVTQLRHQWLGQPRILAAPPPKGTVCIANGSPACSSVRARCRQIHS